MPETWEIFYRDKPESVRVECSAPPVELKGLVDGRTFAVQLTPVEGKPYAVSINDAYRFRKVEE